MKTTQDRFRRPFYVVCIISVALFLLNYNLNNKCNKLYEANKNWIKKYLDMSEKYTDCQITYDLYDMMRDEVLRLEEENEVFGSMLGEIEHEEGGHEILKKLYDETK